MEKLVRYEDVKNFLHIDVTNIDSEFLKACPHKRISDTDLAIYARIVLVENEEVRASTIVNHTIANRWKIDTNVLLNEAIVNSMKYEPLEIKTLDEILMDMGFPFVGETNSPFYIARTTKKYNGAKILAYPSFCNALKEKFGYSCYILPSSIHELLVMKDDGTISSDALKKMVKNTNDKEVAPHERLSNNVYYFDIETGYIKIA